MKNIIKIIFEKDNLERLSITSMKDSPSGEKVFIGNSLGNPFIYTKNEAIPISHSYFSKIESHYPHSYDAVWLSENEILISSLALGGKVLFFRFKNNKADLISKFNIRGAYRFSPIVNNKIILSTRLNGKIYVFQVFKKNNINKDHNVKILKSIQVPYKYKLLTRLIPSKILDIYLDYAYFNDINWITDNTFALNTRDDNSVILMNLNGEILSIKGI